MSFLDDILGNEKNDFASVRAVKGTPAIGALTGTSTSAMSAMTQNPFEITMSLSPLRLSANKNEYIGLSMRIKNISSGDQLVSTDLMLNGNASMLGFDPACINKHTERKIGNLKPGESKDIAIQLWGNNQTKAGAYSVNISVFSHYQNFDKVLGSVKRNLTVRVV